MNVECFMFRRNIGLVANSRRNSSVPKERLGNMKYIFYQAIVATERYFIL